MVITHKEPIPILLQPPPSWGAFLLASLTEYVDPAGQWAPRLLSRRRIYLLLLSLSYGERSRGTYERFGDIDLGSLSRLSRERDLGLSR